MFTIPPPRNRLGTGSPPTTLKELGHSWPGLKVRFAVEEISRPTDWAITAPSHTVIVHLGGRMNLLETEFDGRGSSFGPAVTGEVWCIPAGCRYASYAEGTSIQYAVFSIPSMTDQQFKGAGPGDELSPAAGHLNQTLLLQTQCLLEFISQEDDLSKMEAESLTNSIIGTVSQSYSTRDPAAHTPHRNSPVFSSHQTRALQEFIYDQLDERLTLNRLAVICGMSTHSFLIAFRKALGTTPAQYILRQRLRKAQWLLLHTQSDITEIALATGFASHSHLTASFTKRLGTSPRSFRTINRGKNFCSACRPTTPCRKNSDTLD